MRISKLVRLSQGVEDTVERVDLDRDGGGWVMRTTWRSVVGIVGRITAELAGKRIAQLKRGLESKLAGEVVCPTGDGNRSRLGLFLLPGWPLAFTSVQPIATAPVPTTCAPPPQSQHQGLKTRDQLA